MTAPALLQANDVSKIYRTTAEVVHALRGVSLRIDEGEFVAVMGPSGSGKTTLLNCLSGLDDIDEGEVLLDGQRLHEMNDADRTTDRARSMGFIFQAFNLIPVFSAVENVELPLLLAGHDAPTARSRAEETLARVGLGHRFSHRPTELSGGEQQRVSIARAFVNRPLILLADEPTGNLDPVNKLRVLEALFEGVEAAGATLLAVTHDHDLLERFDRVVDVKDFQAAGGGP